MLSDIGIRNVDAVYHLGDLVGHAANPNEVIWRVRERGIAGVSGNYDSTIATGESNSGSKAASDIEEALSQVSFEFTERVLSRSAKRFLGALPFLMDVRPLGSHRHGPRLVLVHGTPRANTEHWDEDAPEAFFNEMAALADLKAGDLLAFGHTHLQWHRVVDGKHFVNAGSVGRPKDGNWFAGYTLIEYSGNEPPSVQFHRVDYDIAAAVGGLHAAGLPDELAAFLETGGRTFDRSSVAGFSRVGGGA